jgi:zinc transport system permease protein
MEDFILRALAASLGVSVIAGSLGCFVIWKRLSYFSDSISHSALLGVALGLTTGLGINFSLVIVGTLFAVLIVVLQQKSFWSNDTILGIFFILHSQLVLSFWVLLVIEILITSLTFLVIFFRLIVRIFFGFFQ